VLLKEYPVEIQTGELSLFFECTIYYLAKNYSENVDMSKSIFKRVVFEEVI